MKLTGRNITVQIALDPMELAGARAKDGEARTVLDVVAGGRTMKADIATKSFRRAITTVMEHGADGVRLMLQGKLMGDNSIIEAGLAAQPREKKAEAEAA